MPPAPNPELEAIFARTKLETERLRAIANEWTEKYRKIRREKYGDPPSSDDDDNDTQNKSARKDGKDGPARGPGDYGKEKKSSYVIQTNIEPLRNLPGIVGPVDEGLLSGGGGGGSNKRGMKPGMIGLAKTLKVGPQKGRVDSRGGKGTGKRVLEEEEESEEEVGRTGAFKARKKEYVGSSSGTKERMKPVEDKAQAAIASSEEEEDWDGISEGDNDNHLDVQKDVLSEAASEMKSQKKKRKKKKKKNKKDSG